MIIVTGGTGYIGSHTCVELISNGYDVVVLDNLSNSHEYVLDSIEEICRKRPAFFKVDIHDAQKLSEVFDEIGQKADAVIHFAAMKAVGESVEKALDYYTNNMVGLLTLLGVMKKFKCFNLVFSSSAAVYGQASQPPFVETADLEASSPYGRTKLYAEKVLEDVALSEPQWRIALLRYFNPVTAHSSGLIGEEPKGIPNNLFPYVSRVAIGEYPQVSIFGGDYNTPDGTGIRDFIHICDLAEGHVAALDTLHKLTVACPINLGTGSGYSVLEVIKCYESVCQRKIPYEISGRRPGDVGISLADASRAFEILNWRAKHTLLEMCRDDWNWIQSRQAFISIA